MRLPGIEPGSSAWEAPMITITLQALRVYSRRGSNPRPPAHKTGALPLSYWSVVYKPGDRQRGAHASTVRGLGRWLRGDQKEKTAASQMGLEPTIFGSGNRRLIHLATGTSPPVGLEPTISPLGGVRLIH